MLSRLPESDVLYYGLAGRDRPRSLAERLGDLLDHERGKASANGPHTGGEILWQLLGYHSFSVWALATADPPVPRVTEAQLFEAFSQRYGGLPFANRRR